MNQKTKIVQLKKKLTNLNVKFIDIKVLDLRGKLHSLILPDQMFNEDLFENGVGFDAASFGFVRPEKSEMVLVPDINSMFIDPFREKKTAAFFGNIYLVDEKRTRFYNDTRFVAEKAEKMLKKSKIATQAFFSPEFEFFIFKNADFNVSGNGNYYFLEKDMEENGNIYRCGSPEDEYVDFKNEVVTMVQDLGIQTKHHHHSVGVNQHKIEIKLNSLLKTADSSVIIKYVMFNLAQKYDLFVTFIPKPFVGEPGSGWHVHQYLVNGNINVFFKKGKYGNFSREGLNYVSGLLFHSGSLCAFTNPSTNSYKRLVEGFEAPVEATFAQSTKNGAIRIPATVKEKETRMVYRVGDASCNPYLSLSSMLMAGIDGIKKNLDPEKFYFGPFDDGITGSRTFKKKIKSLPRSMTEALVSLEKDNEYLKTGDVFDDGLITQWIKMKKKEVDNIFDIPHPKEFVDYFTF